MALHILNNWSGKRLRKKKSVVSLFEICKNEGIPIDYCLHI